MYDHAIVGVMQDSIPPSPSRASTPCKKHKKNFKKKHLKIFITRVCFLECRLLLLLLLLVWFGLAFRPNQVFACPFFKGARGTRTTPLLQTPRASVPHRTVPPTALPPLFCLSVSLRSRAGARSVFRGACPAFCHKYMFLCCWDSRAVYV